MAGTVCVDPLACLSSLLCVAANAANSKSERKETAQRV